MVLQGHDTTLPVTLADMAYHTRCVARGSQRSFLVTDMPFGSYQESPQQAFRSAAELMAAGAQMVKLEGGAEFADTIRFLTQRGVPVCGHLGLTPQSVHQFGGYRVQGKGEDAEQKLIEDAVELEAAGAGLIVLEAIPAKLGEQATQRLRIPTIGIGAGPGCSGQVLVLHDMLDVFPGKKARFVRNFMKGASGIADAAERYVRAVRDGSFPAEEHSF
jgi:3-methyl-2-oxobutanoate hydroxymethyltransferase